MFSMFRRPPLKSMICWFFRLDMFEWCLRGSIVLYFFWLFVFHAFHGFILLLFNHVGNAICFPIMQDLHSQLKELIPEQQVCLLLLH